MFFVEKAKKTAQRGAIQNCPCPFRWGVKNLTFLFFIFVQKKLWRLKCSVRNIISVEKRYPLFSVPSGTQYESMKRLT